VKKVIYIAGPMSGIPGFNFAAFDEARDGLIEEGWEVVSPADLDRAVGFDPSAGVVSKEFLDEAMERDIAAILRVDALVMLPGWRTSTGAKAEYALAKWRHIPVFEWPQMEEVVDVAGGSCAGDPKAEAGSKKCPMWLLPPIALEETAWVHQLGASKYGPYNWRLTGVALTTYISAIMRHLMAIAKGEWIDPESGRPHATHIAASCNILMDAEHHGKLDR
jgi:hypothetical protein